MNGYFRVCVSSASTDLELFAPTEGGTPLTVTMVTEYLASKGISYDLAMVSKAVVESATADTRIILQRRAIPPLGVDLIVEIEQDKMSAYLTMYAGSNDNMKMNANDIKTTLAFRGVKFGLKEELINELAEKPRYCEKLVVAEGMPAEPSTDGYIEYLFNTDRNQRPTQLEDGSVDFFHLNILQHCAKGQAIAKMHKPVKGENGCCIDGTIVKSRDPLNVSFKYGNNISVSEDGLELRANVDGNVSYVAGQVFVNDSITFENIGPATGNIEFEGDVVVTGNVDTNFSVKTKGDVTVNGVVEGAVIEAGGNIIIAKGVNGMGRARLSAGRNIIAKYMENVVADAGGYISAEAIMHSTITAGTDIIVDGRKGMLSGGKATAGGAIEVKNLGAEMANDTVVEVGLSPIIKKEMNDLRKDIAEKQKTLASIMPVMQNLALKIKSGAALTDEQKGYVAKLMSTQKSTTEEIEKMSIRLSELEEAFGKESTSEVRVKGTVYPGTKVCISDVSMSVKTPAKYCKFVRLRGDVKITSYE